MDPTTWTWLRVVLACAVASLLIVIGLAIAGELIGRWQTRRRQRRLFAEAWEKHWRLRGLQQELNELMDAIEWERP